MFMDRTIIQRHDAYAVQAQRCEVMWRDGSTVILHPVQGAGGVEAPRLRAMRGGDGGWFVFDIARIAPSLADDLRELPPRDHQGAVFYTLRTQFRSAAEFAQRAAEQFLACWHSTEQVAA